MDGNLPLELMESILLLLPVKQILRLRAVCKSWNFTITSHSFSVAHLHHQRTTTNNLFLVPQPPRMARNLPSIQLQLEGSPRLHILTAFDEHPPKISGEYWPTLCRSSDGLVLVQDRRSGKYAIWNPWTRSSITIKPKDYYRVRDEKLFCGLCYDSLIENYKMVITDLRRYAVFNCKNMCWSEFKDADAIDLQINSYTLCGGGVSTRSGDFYWIVCTCPGLGPEPYTFDIVCFDLRKETFKKMPQLEENIWRNCWLVRFVSTWTHPCLLLAQSDDLGESSYRTFVLKRDGDDEYSWTELVLRVPPSISSYSLFPVYVASHNQVILEVEKGVHFVSYNPSEQTCTEFETDAEFESEIFHYTPVSPTLFFMRK